ncbi:cyclin-O-like isoform X2 [Mizuhopecten yessoensis]|uniref:cyclin-O-like isoform X2 n=1 Tax=Mizuhopecten yessoensis TaxID=6573 RepID=UPI000B45A81C|nr:cyclin-O-like isoform X2 [Mizuhopecten yessoensis]
MHPELLRTFPIPMSVDSPPALFPCVSLSSYPVGTCPDVLPAADDSGSLSASVTSSYVLAQCQHPVPSQCDGHTIGTYVNNCSVVRLEPPPPGDVTSQGAISSSAPVLHLAEMPGGLSISTTLMNYICSEYQDVEVGLFVGDPKDPDRPEVCTPPDTAPENPSLADSGYDDSLNLQCLETVLDWKGVSQSPGPAPLFLSSTLLHSPDHRGFEDYLDDIYYHRLSIEYKYQVNNCLEGQREVTPGMRGLLISWMTGVHHQLIMCQDSLFVAVNIVDRILDIMHASRDYLQLLGIASLLIAAKCEEVSPPEITELLSCCTDTYSRDQVKHLERVILNAIKFDLLVPTPQFFLEYFSSCCISLFGGFQSDRLRQARAHARCVLELSLQEYDLSQVRPSLLALCVWKVAVDLTQCDDGEFVPPGLDFRREEFQNIYTQVRTFSENLKKSFPEVSSICEYYFNLYGAE